MKISRTYAILILIVIAYILIKFNQHQKKGSDLRTIIGILIYVFAFAATDLIIICINKYIELEH